MGSNISTGPGEISIRVGWSPVVSIYLIVYRLVPPVIKSPEDSGFNSRPEITFAHTLKENTKIKIIPGSSQIKPIGVMGRRISNYFHIPVISQGIISVKDYAISVQIFEFNIAGHRVAVYFIRGGRDFGLVSTICVFIIGFKESICFITPYLANFLSHIIISQIIVGVIIFCYPAGIIRNNYLQIV